MSKKTSKKMKKTNVRRFKPRPTGIPRMKLTRDNLRKKIKAYRALANRSKKDDDRIRVMRIVYRYENMYRSKFAS